MSRNTVYALLAFISFFVLLCTLGAMESDMIPFEQCVIRGTLSLIAFAVFAKMAGAFEPYTEEER